MADKEPTHGSSSGDVTFDFLDLPDCTTLRKDRIEHILLVRASYRPKLTDACPLCRGSWLHTGAQYLKPFWDIPRGSCPVLVQLFFPIRHCGVCGKGEFIDFGWHHATRGMTDRLEDYILEQATTLSTFTQIALNTGQDTNTVIRIFLSKFRKFDRERGKDLPRVLEIDEVFFHDKFYTIFVDGESGASVDLLEGRINEIIKARLMQAGNPEAVEYVTQDFYDPYRSLTTKPIEPNKKQGKRPVSAENSDDETFDTPLYGVMPRKVARASGERDRVAASNVSRRLLPNAKTVGDHFHFKRTIQKSFDDVRIDVKNSLNRFFFNRLKKTYTREELADPTIRKKLNAEVGNLAKRRADEIEQKRKIWSRKSKNTGVDDLLERDIIFTDHPILEKAWHARNKGIAEFGNLAWPTSAVCSGPPLGTLMLRELGSAGA